MPESCKEWGTEKSPPGPGHHIVNVASAILWQVNSKFLQRFYAQKFVIKFAIHQSPGTTLANICLSVALAPGSSIL
jgi:hypothetical protein